MSGAWAREADYRARFLHPDSGLERAAHHLAGALTGGTSYVRLNPSLCAGTVEHHLAVASAIIRRERKRLDPQGMTAKHGDWGDRVGDESLIWYALRAVAIAANSTPSPAWHLREAEAALRTLHKRGRVG